MPDNELTDALKNLGKPAEEVKAEATEAPKETAPEPEKVAEVPKQEESPKEAGDIFKTLAERTSGKISKEEDLTSLLGVNEEKASLQSELETYKAKTAEYESKQSDWGYANDFTATLDGMYKNGATQQQIETFLSLQGKDFTSIDGLEAKTLRLMHEKGFTRDQAIEEIHDTYNLNEGKYDTEEVEKAKRRLDRNKQEDVSYLEGLRKDASSIGKKADPEELRRKETERSVFEAQVNGFASEVANKFKGVGQLELTKDEGGPINFELNYNEDFLKSTPELIKNYMLTQGLKPGKDAEEQSADYLKKVYFATHGERLLKTVAEHTRAQVLERETARNSNRAPRQHDAPRQEGGAELTVNEAIKSQLTTHQTNRKFFGN